MRKIIEVMRLHHDCGCTRREIARAIGASPTTVGDYPRRAELAGLSYPLPTDLDEVALKARLFPPAQRLPRWPSRLGLRPASKISTSWQTAATSAVKKSWRASKPVR